MRAQDLADRRPGSVLVVVAQRRLDGHQQMIRHHAEEDVRFDPSLQLMEDRSFGQGTFHRPERRLGAGQRDVQEPRFRSGEILAIRA